MKEIKKNTKKQVKKINNTKVSKNNKKKGFTLIELLAVIIILGVLMIIAIPSVTTYISNSRKSSYIDSVKNLMSAARTLVNSGKLDIYDIGTVYYLPISCMPSESGKSTPYGEFSEAYVLVTYNGDGYDYYYTGTDTSHMGIKKVIAYDNLKAEDLEPDIEDTDIKKDVSIEGRKNIVIYNSDCTDRDDGLSAHSKIDDEGNVDDIVAICKKATTLHTATCYVDDGTACGRVMNYGDTITYGSIPGDSMKPGDAYDCDVNGDGIYNASTERFYYVSDYFDTNTKSFDRNYATMIYYNNFENGHPDPNGVNYYYQAEPDSTKGPLEAKEHLPNTSYWTNIKLKKTSRAILGEYQNMHNLTNISGVNLPTKFSYEGKTARLLSGQELMRACNLSGLSSSVNIYNCTFLFENSKFETKSSQVTGIWLENPSNNSCCAWSTYYYDIELSNNSSTRSTMGVKPVIDVNKSDIE